LGAYRAGLVDGYLRTFNWLFVYLSG